eukprot:Skav209531  [mRNA]  locus=scaffold2497:1804:9066:- [translate_table: standard]
MVAGPLVSLVALADGQPLPPLPLDMAEPELRPDLALPRLQPGRSAGGATGVGGFTMGPLGGFCGALSAFSGTIGDIADVQFGCATEDSMLDVPSEKKSSKGTQQLGATTGRDLVLLKCHLGDDAEGEADAASTGGPLDWQRSMRFHGSNRY